MAQAHSSSRRSEKLRQQQALYVDLLKQHNRKLEYECERQRLVSSLQREPLDLNKATQSARAPTKSSIARRPSRRTSPRPSSPKPPHQRALSVPAQLECHSEQQQQQPCCPRPSRASVMSAQPSSTLHFNEPRKPDRNTAATTTPESTATPATVTVGGSAETSHSKVSGDINWDTAQACMDVKRSTGGSRRNAELGSHSPHHLCSSRRRESQRDLSPLRSSPPTRQRVLCSKSVQRPKSSCKVTLSLPPSAVPPRVRGSCGAGSLCTAAMDQSLDTAQPSSTALQRKQRRTCSCQGSPRLSKSAGRARPQPDHKKRATWRL